jgi:HPt (histidine-containing phosphotransfer) domain-containing protein
MSDTPAIDISWLRKTFDDDTVLAELYTMYLDDTTKRMADLSDALSANDTARCTHVSHAMKGSSGNVGATPMRELAGRLEKHDWTADPAGGTVLAAQLESEFMRVQAWIRDFLAAVPAAR